VEYLSDALIPVQRIGVMDYYNLTVSGNRGGRTIALGNGIISPASSNQIRLYNNFTVTATNYVVANDTKYSNFDFAATIHQSIPGFTYGSITSTGAAARTFDPNGSANPERAVVFRSYNLPLVGVDYTAYACTGSRLIYDRDNVTGPSAIGGAITLVYHDFIVRGNLNGNTLSVPNGVNIACTGAFEVNATNFTQPAKTWIMRYVGAAGVNQTIKAYRTNTATNTPAWSYNEIRVLNSNRVITLGGAGTDTIIISSALSVPTVGSFTVPNTGFDVAGSTINFTTGSGTIPVQLVWLLVVR
jgi:hypothetical protein